MCQLLATEPRKFERSKGSIMKELAAARVPTKLSVLAQGTLSNLKLYIAVTVTVALRTLATVYILSLTCTAAIAVAVACTHYAHT
jgi:hypothetical protein